MFGHAPKCKSEPQGSYIEKPTVNIVIRAAALPCTAFLRCGVEVNRYLEEDSLLQLLSLKLAELCISLRKCQSFAAVASQPVVRMVSI